MHHTAPENDLLRRVSQHVICHSLSDVVTFQFPDILSSGQFSSLSAIPALNRRTGSQSFQTGTVIRTAAFIGILRVLAQEDMSALGMHQAMQQSAVNICPYTYSRTNGDIERILTPLGCAEAYLAKHCSIDICIKTYRDFQCFPERSRKIIKSPCQLRSAGNIAVGCRFFIQIHRAETADPQCLDSFILKICYHFRHRTLRCLRREYCPVENISLLISYGTYHLCAAGFNSA